MYPQVFGKYVLERELARGGMARVLLATLRGASGFEKKLVVKQIRDELSSDEDFVRRFVEEAKTTVALSHPNIVPVYELGVELGTYFLAMEYVAGASAAELVRASDGSGLSPEEGAYVGVEVCRALDYAHRRMHVVHRDVTPRNVMVDEEGQVKVIDFGISAPVATAPGGHGVFGSPGHMPPEQMAGTELTPAADVFAVAALLMELWTGKPPFRRGTLVAIEEAMRGPRPKPSEACARLSCLDAVIASALSLDASARPQQAEVLARTLRSFLSGVDLGDLARQLGARVRDARERSLTAAPVKGAALQRPASRPTGMQVRTRTFAARDGLAEAIAVSTRKIASNAPPPGDDHVGAPPPLSLLRAFQTPAFPTPDASIARARLWRIAMGAGALVAVGLYVRASGRPQDHPPAPPALSPASEQAPLPASAAALSPRRASARASAQAPWPDSAPASAQAPSPSPVSAPTSATASGHERAELVLLGDGTQVAIDGVSSGPLPMRKSVDPGSHSVVFTFPATGESKAAAVTLRAGERATLRADFTGVRPTIRVAR